MRKKRINKKMNGSRFDKTEDGEAEDQPLRNSLAHKRERVTGESSFETNLILAVVLLLLIGVGLYFVVIANLNGQTSTSLPPSGKAIYLRKTQEKRTSSDHRNGSFGKQQSVGKPTFVELWIQRIKKLSTEISMEKLNRARQMLLELSSPTSPGVYEQEFDAYVRDYEINKFVEKPVCIVVPTYNNMKDRRYQKNIDSILIQQYENYRVIVIDDASDDGTGEAIESRIATHRVYQEGRIKIQKNPSRRMALVNIIEAAENFCKQDDIFMVVDGDDYLLGRHVLQLFNAAFSSQDAWVVYSNFLTASNKVGYSRRYPPQITESREFRKVLFIISHLRAFYTRLLLQIKKQDLQDESGSFFHAANDVAIFMPILQMASDHVLYLAEINYFYNSETGMNNHQEKKKEQIKNDRLVRSRPKYEKIGLLFSRPANGSSPHFYEETSIS